MRQHSRRFIVVLIGACASAFAQTVTSLAPLPAGTVVTDGSKNPSAITDSRALGLWFGSLGTVTPTSSSSTTGLAFSLTPRQSSLLTKKLKFQSSDVNALMGAAYFWKSQVAGAKSQSQADTMTAGYVTALPNSMTAAGWGSFYAYLQKEKASMKTYDYPMNMK